MRAREAQVLALVARGLRERGMAPSVVEIARGLGISPGSRGYVHKLLSALVRQGLLVRLPRRARALALVPGVWAAVQPPGEDMRLERVA